MAKDRARDPHRKATVNNYLPAMGDALGWSRLDGGTAVDGAKEGRSIEYEAITGERPPGLSEYADVGKAHVKVKN